MKSTLRLLVASVTLAALASAAEMAPTAGPAPRANANSRAPRAPAAPQPTAAEVARLQNENAQLRAQLAALAPPPADLATLKIAPIADVIKTAVADTPGKVAKVTLESKDGATAYAVEISGMDYATTIVMVDAASGKVTGSVVDYAAKKSGAPMAGGAMKPGSEEDDDD